MKNESFKIMTPDGLVDRVKVGFLPTEVDAEIETRSEKKRIKVFQTNDGRQYWRDENGTIRRIKKDQIKKRIEP